jgi:hypothetical protein
MRTAQPLIDVAPEEDAIETNADGHTTDRTEMLPWDSCGPECPVCAEFEN